MATIFSRLRHGLLILVFTLLSYTAADAEFTSIYAFGDGVCTTTASPAPASLYSGGRFCDGPVWIEKLSEFQGIAYDPNKNISFFGHTSGQLLTTTSSFVAPADAATSLFIIWSADADFVDFMTANDPPYGNTGPWNILMQQSIADHTTAVNTLYSKGARLLIMPNAVDVSAVPEFNFFAAADRAFVLARVQEYNGLFTAALDDLEANLEGLIIIRPDTFTFFNDVEANPASFGMVNPVPENAAIIDTANPWEEGRNFIFWDPLHPTAKFQNELALFVNAMIPVPDTTPPVLTLPGDLVVAATGPQGAVVDFTVSALDEVDGPVPALALPSAGSTFPIGTTTVLVSATDDAGNVAEDSFMVTVVDMTRLLQDFAVTHSGGQFAISGRIHGGPPSGEATLQASTDLGKEDPWQVIATIPLDEAGNQLFGPLTDPEAAEQPRNFFRASISLSP